MSPPPPIAVDVLMRVGAPADRYGIHAALDARWGRRGEIGFLWSIGRLADGWAARVRLPPAHAGADQALPILPGAVGLRLGFRLCANITHKDGRSGRRISWPREEIAPRLRWLERRAMEHGFQVEEASPNVGRAFIRKGKGFWVDETTFHGTLTVTDAEAFARALVGGVGQRSSFGFGLLETFSHDYSTIRSH